MTRTRHAYGMFARSVTQVIAALMNYTGDDDDDDDLIDFTVFESTPSLAKRLLNGSDGGDEDAEGDGDDTKPEFLASSKILHSPSLRLPL